MDQGKFKNLLTLKNLTIVFIALTIFNLIYLIYLKIGNPKSTIIEKVITKSLVPNSSQNTSQDLNLICPQSCINQIYQATSASSIAPEPTASELTPTPANTTAVKEFFIPLGQGSSSAGDWEDIPGVQATIDTNNFPELKSVVFETTFRIPTGNEIAYIRLYNATDKHPIWTSEISLEGGGTKLLTKTITFDSGLKTYQVQMKTSLKFLAIFDQARLHIITY